MVAGTEPEREDGTANPYTVRRFHPEDRDGVMALDSVVWDRDRGTDWFQWKYERNPLVDRTPIFVAERDGEIVGARPFIPVRLRVGDVVLDALQASDTMVHPDHRRRGIFSRMTERAIEAYADGDPALIFNYPNAAARSGYEKLGWRTLDGQVTYYRLQNPARLVSARFDDTVGSLLRRVFRPLVREFRRDGCRLDSPPDVEITARAKTPCSTLASLYAGRVPDRVHVLRDEAFLRWRFASPAWSRTVYLAKRRGSAEAALVARTRTLADGVTVTQIVDVVPMTGDDRWSKTVGLLLAAAVRNNRDSNLLSVAPGHIPTSILRSLGFRPDDRPPLSWFRATSKSLAYRPLPLEESPRTPAGRSLHDPDSWVHTFVERDTA